MNDNTDPLAELAALARQETPPTVPMDLRVLEAVRNTQREVRIQSYFLSSASAAAALILLAALPAVTGGLDPLDALFHMACGPLQ